MIMNSVNRVLRLKAATASFLPPLALALALLLLVASATVYSDNSVSEEAEDLVRTFLKAWESGDQESFEASLHADVLFAYPGGELNKAELLSLYSDYQLQKTDIRIYLWDVVVAEEDRFATAYQFAATDRHSGLRQAVGTGIVGRVESGRLILIKEYYDEDVATMQYRGELPLDEGSISPWPSSIWLRPETID